MNPARKQNVLEAIRLNDRQAFEKYSGFIQTVESLCISLRQRLVTAENMVQDVFLKL